LLPAIAALVLPAAFGAADSLPHRRRARARAPLLVLVGGRQL